MKQLIKRLISRTPYRITRSGALKRLNVSPGSNRQYA